MSDDTPDFNLTRDQLLGELSAMKLRAEKAELQREIYRQETYRWRDGIRIYKEKLQTAERERDEARADLKTVVDGVIDALGISKPGSQSIFWYIESLRKERDALRAENARLREALEKIANGNCTGTYAAQFAQAALAGKGESK